MVCTAIPSGYPNRIEVRAELLLREGEEEVLISCLSAALAARDPAVTMRAAGPTNETRSLGDLLRRPAAGGGLGRPTGDGGLRISLIGDLPRAGRASVHPDQMARTRLR